MATAAAQATMKRCWRNTWYTDPRDMTVEALRLATCDQGSVWTASYPVEWVRECHEEMARRTV